MKKETKVKKQLALDIKTEPTAAPEVILQQQIAKTQKELKELLNEAAILEGRDPEQEPAPELSERQKLDNFTAVCNMQPPQKMILTHPFKAGAKYLPVDFLEMELDRIFLGQYDRHIVNYNVLDMHGEVAVHCHIRLKLVHPVTGLIKVVDGLGAAVVKKAKSSGKIMMSTIDQIIPMAEAFAFKNAAAKLGKRFGRDINRKADTSYNSFYKK